MNAGTRKGLLPLAVVLRKWDSLSSRWALDPGERSALVGGFEGGPVDRVETYRLLCGEQRIRLLVEAEPVLSRVVGDDAAVRVWLRKPNVNLAGRTPVEVLAATPEWMRWLIDNAGCGA